MENVFGPNGLAEQVTDSSQAPEFASADALGTIRLITDGSGMVVGTGSYDAWGTPDTGSVTLGGFGFTGEQVDPETGFVYLRNRSYDPTSSRFLTPDPLGALGSGVNLYAYVGNNPATQTDPSGLDDENPDGAYNEATMAGILEGITYQGAPSEYIAYTNFEYALQTEAEATAPEGAGAFGPAGEGGTYCSETEGPPPTTEGGNGGGSRDIRPIRGGSGEEPEEPGNPGRKYDPSPKHDQAGGWGTPMNLDNAAAQKVLNAGFESGKQVYGYSNGQFYEFQPDNQGGYHGYPVSAGDVPTEYLRQLRNDGIISNAEYNKFVKQPPS